MSLRPLILAATLGVSLLAGAQAPTPVVEKTTTHFGRMTRVSLFSNQVVVVAIHSEIDDFTHQATLGREDYMFYLRILEEAADKIGNHPVSSKVESRDSISTLVLHVGPGAPRIFRYSPLASLDLSLSKIVGVVDDLQRLALGSLPGEYEVNQWQPEIGDCVELRHGGEACVTAIGENGAIELTRNDVLMTFTVAKESRTVVIARIIEPQP